MREGYLQALAYTFSDVSYWLYLMTFCCMTLAFYVVTNVETSVFSIVKYGLSKTDLEGTRRSYMENTLWFLTPAFVFGLIYALVVERWGKRWIIAVIATAIMSIGCAVMLPIPKCNQGDDDCVWHFAPFFLVGVGHAFTHTILLSLLPYIAHPYSLATCLGFMLSISISSQSIYMSFEGSDDALERW